jgi:hypothetical protein
VTKVHSPDTQCSPQCSRAARRPRTFGQAASWGSSRLGLRLGCCWRRTAQNWNGEARNSWLTSWDIPYKACRFVYFLFPCSKVTLFHLIEFFRHAVQHAKIIHSYPCISRTASTVWTHCITYIYRRKSVTFCKLQTGSTVWTPCVTCIYLGKSFSHFL